MEQKKDEYKQLKFSKCGVSVIKNIQLNNMHTRI